MGEIDEVFARIYAKFIKNLDAVLAIYTSSAVCLELETEVAAIALQTIC